MKPIISSSHVKIVLVTIGIVVATSNAYVLQQSSSFSLSSSSRDSVLASNNYRHTSNQPHYKNYNVQRLRQITLRMNTDDEDDDEENNEVPPVGTSIASNVIGTNLCECCANVRNTGIGTGFYRNGYCTTGEQDYGRHTVCVQVTNDFLQFSKDVGNDLSTPVPQYMFPGLKDGDYWCLCAQRWVQAYQAGKAPKLLLTATHEKTLSYVPYDILQQYAIDQQTASEQLNNLNDIRNQLNKLIE